MVSSPLPPLSVSASPEPLGVWAPPSPANEQGSALDVTLNPWLKVKRSSPSLPWAATLVTPPIPDPLQTTVAVPLPVGQTPSVPLITVIVHASAPVVAHLKTTEVVVDEPICCDA